MVTNNSELASVISQILRELPETYRPFEKTEYPMPVSQAILGGLPDLRQLKNWLPETANGSLKEACDCRRCIDICPVKALHGKCFRPEEPREFRQDAKKCDRYFKAMERKGELKVCGMCLYVCPFGMTGAKTNHSHRIILSSIEATEQR